MNNRSATTRPANNWRRRTALAAASAITFLGLAVPQAQATTAAEEQASWAVQPGGNATQAARTSFTYTLRPGATLRDTVRIINTGSRPIKLDLYSADAFLTGRDGAFAIRQRDERKVSVGKWIKFGKRTRFTVRPGKALQIPFMLKVPRNATPGDHSGAILGVGVKLEKSGKGKVGVDVRRRVGTRIYLRVEGRMRPSVSVREIKATGKPALFPFVGGDGKTTVSYQISNPGNVRIAPDAHLELRGPFGNVVDRIPVEVPELLPGSSITQTASFDKLPPWGKLSAQLVLTSADANASAQATVWSVPWAPFTLLLVLVAAFFVRRKVRANRPRGTHASA